MLRKTKYRSLTSWWKKLRLRHRVPSYKKPRRPREARRFPRRYLALFMLTVLIVAFAYSFYRFDRTILPLVLEAAELELQTEINHVINAVIQDIIRENQIRATDFYTRHDHHPTGPLLSVNTVLVNDLSNEAALRISQQLSTLEPEIVSVPLGMAFNLDTLAQVGPRFTFTMAPIGNALVSHHSHFTAVGINQIHFSVSLTVEAVVRIINPVHSSEITVDRHIALVDTIISGIVPDTYLHMDAPPTIGWGQ